MNGVVKEDSVLMDEVTSSLLANSIKLGYTFSEELLHKIDKISPINKKEIFDLITEITGLKKNWTPLVKNWGQPTGESIIDHIITQYANVFNLENGTKLPCGHIIPQHTFPLERYNGCPFCGTPFEFEKLKLTGTVHKLKTLELWAESDLQNHLLQLIESPVSLDCTQVDSLKLLISAYGLPKDFNVGIKETLMVLADTLVEQNRSEEAGKLFSNPNDILRYLWYKHTGLLQIIEPKTIIGRLSKNAGNWHKSLDTSNQVKLKTRDDLRLKYNRAECKLYATWLNNIPLDVEKQCEIMHPKRGMWVRFIRALRLAEYSKRKGYEKLATLLDVFYNEKYKVWQGRVNHYKLKGDAETTFALLKQRPGLFARSLFSTMLWFGKDTAIQHFREVMNEVPPRLVYTLNMYAQIYFDKNHSRIVKPLGGVNKHIPANQLLSLYSDEELMQMQMLVQDLSLDLIKNRLAEVENTNTTIYIDEGLYNIPIAIGDRSDNLQDLSGALMGTRFQVEGDTVRLFLQWGEGLPAQHLDMDLSCRVTYANNDDYCSYAQLEIPGCKHSGDIQKIPSKVGTAEYIDINLDELTEKGAKYVSFTCNAYTSGSLAPNLVVGWMNSTYPMQVTDKGVAYEPSAVQHQVRINNKLSKGMVFGVLDILKREIVWLEMPFSGQVTQNLNIEAVETLLKKLDSKLKIGQLLALKAKVQGLSIVEEKENAEEVYDLNWALNTAKVNDLFLGNGHKKALDAVH